MEPIVDQTTPPETDSSLAEHEAAHYSTRTMLDDEDRQEPEPAKAATPAATPETPAVADGKPVSKQAARPADVPRINQLTQRLRSEERRAQDLERQLAELRSAQPAASSPLPGGVTAASTPAAVPVAAGRPKLEDFATAEDPYGAYLKADAKWEIREELRQEREAEAAARAKGDAETQQNERITTFSERVESFMETHGDYVTVVESIKDEKPPDLLLTALIDADNGPELLYALAKNDALRLELHLVTEDKPVTPQNVATVQRLLKTRIATANTGSVRPTQVRNPAPPPPNPVRTGPIRSGKELPGDDSSLAEHEQAFSRPRR